MHFLLSSHHKTGPGVVDLKCRYKSSSCCSCTNVSFCFLVLKSTKMTYGSKQVDLNIIEKRKSSCSIVAERKFSQRWTILPLESWTKNSGRQKKWEGSAIVDYTIKASERSRSNWKCQDKSMFWDLHVKSSPPVQPRQPINSDPTIIQNPLSFTANIHSVWPSGMTGSLPNSSYTARFVPRRPTQAINWSNERVMLSALNDVKTSKRVLNLSLIALVSLGKPY
ncbi:hypothetical protein L2E82_08294 [Cichorium intybus]|uniref:Uncharacterized protein n=1 Tax=Cichorium intybus TaxID=13427 RepID=A0ACB9G670_CICIN|nr:hypothetical protein L2E82_08294 [Cichorium intybus]